MKSILFFTVVVIFTIQAFSQSKDAYINDPDGYTNVRSDKSVDGSVVTTISDGELFKCSPATTSNWWAIVTNEGISGYVHKSRIVTVEDQAVEISGLFKEIKETNPNNAEFGETSNEQLFIFAEKFPMSFLMAFSKLDQSLSDKIIAELETPIHDLIDLKLVYRRINSVVGYSSFRERISKALIDAGKAVNIDVTKE